MKNQEEILLKMGISTLNTMQEMTLEATENNNEIVLLSPTGSGKTLAFLLPILATLRPEITTIQALIVVPSRELAIQIEQVIREMGSGNKANAVYGGRNFTKDVLDLKHPPALLIGTPGRIADHLRRNTFSTENIETIVLDEFDKSLEIGFEKDMSEIISLLPSVTRKLLTSATQGVEIPDFVGLKNPKLLDFLAKKESQLETKLVISPSRDKLETLFQLVSHLGEQSGIIFCNFKDTIQQVSNFLTAKGIQHGTFYGGMEQKDRERSLIKFRNGTYRILLATDLAARGIDVPELKFIIHYHLPLRSEEFTHRNGRTARMNKEGSAYVLKWKNEQLPEFIDTKELNELLLATTETSGISPTLWTTLFISGGRGDKISKGDIAGFLLKQGGLTNDEIGTIELKQDCAFVAVATNKLSKTIEKLNNTKLKQKKVRLTAI
jgi:superfamily II DNA/RNA helicase